MTNEKTGISILIPTRKRPHFMRSVVQSAQDTADNKDDIEFVFYIDDDDKESVQCAKSLGSSVNTIVGPRIVLSRCWNECQKVAKHSVFMHCGDDILFRTKGWDSIVLGKFSSIPDRIAFIYGKDGIQPNTFGTHGFIHKNWVDVVGYFVPPYFSCDYNDTWLNDVAKKIGRHFFVDIYTEHMHPSASKYIIDETHRERIKRGREDNVDKMYSEYEGQRVHDAIKLNDFISDFKVKL